MTIFVSQLGGVGIPQLANDPNPPYLNVSSDSGNPRFDIPSTAVGTSLTQIFSANGKYAFQGLSLQWQAAASYSVGWRVVIDGDEIWSVTGVPVSSNDDREFKLLSSLSSLSASDDIGFSEQSYEVKQSILIEASCSIASNVTGKLLLRPIK